MGYKVVYFSRTGTSKRVAQKVANKLSCEVVEISDGMDWRGLGGYVKAGYYSVFNKNVSIKLNGNIEKTDEVVLVSPLWAGGLASATRAFLKEFPVENIHLVATSNSSNVKGYSGLKSLNEVIRNMNNEDMVIETLVDKLR